MTDKLVTHALMEGYKGRLMKGKYPVAVVFLRVPPNQVDVNVHPAKAEVRFINANMVHDALSATVTESLDSLDHTPWKTPPNKPIRTEAEEDLLRQPPSQESFASYAREEPSWIKAAAATPPRLPCTGPNPCTRPPGIPGRLPATIPLRLPPRRRREMRLFPDPLRRSPTRPPRLRRRKLRPKTR